MMVCEDKEFKLILLYICRNLVVIGEIVDVDFTKQFVCF